MGLGFDLGRICFFVLFFVYVAKGVGSSRAGPRAVFNVLNYGAASDPRVDSTRGFLNAWNDACRWKGKSMVYVPYGTFILSPVTFKGPCNGPVAFRIKGTVKAHHDLVFNEQWILFQYVDRLSVSGRGVLDGVGALAWPYNYCSKHSGCRQLPVTMSFAFVTNSRIHHIKSLNSKNTHFNVFGCTNLSFDHVRISAPADSPNTDGIRIGASTRIYITNSVIGTGDDCVSILEGSRDIQVSQVVCGPGHGISIGSLGKNKDEQDVTGVFVTDSTFVGTTNGVRIKTWAASPGSSVASNLHFENLNMMSVFNPIVIDQQYCPYPPCDKSSGSLVQIRDVWFRNIWGISRTKTAVSLLCSQNRPCSNVHVDDINLTYNGPGGPATSSCVHISGRSAGRENPPQCI